MTFNLPDGVNLIDNTRFRSLVNFSGDFSREARENYPRMNARHAKVVLPNAEQALYFQSIGCHVWVSHPHDADGNPTGEEIWMADLNLRYAPDSDPKKAEHDPQVYIVTAPGAIPVLLDEATVGEIDRYFDDRIVNNVCAIVNLYKKDPKPGQKEPKYWNFYIREMYIEIGSKQSALYSRYHDTEQDDQPEPDETMPF